MALILVPGSGAPPPSVPGVAGLDPGVADVFPFATQVDADFIGFHDPRDRLAPEALTMMPEALARAPQTALAFAVGAPGYPNLMLHGAHPVLRELGVPAP